MDSKYLSTADTSSIIAKLDDAKGLFAQKTPAERMERIRRVQAKIDDLERRGLLRRRSYDGGYPSPSSIGGSVKWP